MVTQLKSAIYTFAENWSTTHPTKPCAHETWTSSVEQTAGALGVAESSQPGACLCLRGAWPSTLLSLSNRSLANTHLVGTDLSLLFSSTGAVFYNKKKSLDIDSGHTTKEVLGTRRGLPNSVNLLFVLVCSQACLALLFSFSCNSVSHPLESCLPVLFSVCCTRWIACLAYLSLSAF